jgi:hypothetical protein
MSSEKVAPLPGLLSAPPQAEDKAEAVLDLRDPKFRRAMRLRQGITRDGVRRDAYELFIEKQEIGGKPDRQRMLRAMDRRKEKGMTGKLAFARRVDAAIEKGRQA